MWVGVGLHVQIWSRQWLGKLLADHPHGDHGDQGANATNFFRWIDFKSSVKLDCTRIGVGHWHRIITVIVMGERGKRIVFLHEYSYERTQLLSFLLPVANELLYQWMFPHILVLAS